MFYQPIALLKIKIMKNLILFLTLAILFIAISCTTDSQSDEIIISQKRFIEESSVDFSSFPIENPTETVALESNKKYGFPINSWTITPLKLKDENLSMYYYHGHLFETTWFVNKYFTSVYPSSGRVPTELRRSIGYYRHDFIPPLVVQFFAKRGIEYRLSFKVENYQSNNNKLTVLIDESFVGYIRLNSSNEYVFTFKKESTKQLKIAIGGFYRNYNTNYLKISEIKVEQFAY